MEFIGEELTALKEKGLYRAFRTIEGAQGPRVRIGGREIVLLCSNDYLGLANHPALRKAAEGALKRYGFGAGASRLVSGTMVLHRELEERIAAFKGTESALLFNSGYAANTGVIPALAGRGDTVFSDRLNHASIVDGCLLSRATVRRYRHADVGHLERLLADAEKSRTRLIVTDGVFSMDGDVAPLAEIVKLAGRYGAAVMVDDAHGTGVIGENGRGTAEHLGVDMRRIDVHMGTLGKGLGAFGAFVAGSKDVIDLLVNRARPFIYSTALPPAVVVAALAALDIIEREPERRVMLWEKARFMRKGLEELGFDTMNSGTQIIPLLVGDAGKAVAMTEALLAENVFAQAVRPPTVPEGTARIRVTVTAVHSQRDLEKALDAFKKAGREVGLI